MRLFARGLLALLAGGFGYAAYLYLTLPDVRPLRTANPATSAFIELRAREAEARGEKPKRIQRWVSYGRISPRLVSAVIVTEDATFWSHEGVDFEQLKESMEINLERMEFARGASTITQQLAKNLYLSPSKNPVRKLRELLIARRLEAELPKQRILEIYLNVIEWGDGIYGAEAAARTYFRKPAAYLDAAEAALLAAAIRNPRALNPGRPTARLRRWQQLVLRRMGAAPAPPVLAGPPVPAPPGSAQQTPPEPVQPLPTAELPHTLPGQVVPPPRPPGVKPPGGGS